jgi:hypothetical protein
MKEERKVGIFRCFRGLAIVAGCVVVMGWRARTGSGAKRHGGPQGHLPGQRPADL